MLDLGTAHLVVPTCFVVMLGPDPSIPHGRHGRDWVRTGEVPARNDPRVKPEDDGKPADDGMWGIAMTG
jgi:hypothetical protein